jgi:hypothetical protein
MIIGKTLAVVWRDQNAYRADFREAVSRVLR